MPEALQKLRLSLRQRQLYERINSDAALRALYSHDVFFRAAHTPVAILQPRHHREIATLVGAATDCGLSIEVRAGGMSYSGGYLVQNERSAVLDVSALRGIDYAHGGNDIVVVEAGVTWQQLDDFLRGTGMRPAINAPFSGSVSTIGGAIRQGLPADMHAVLALELVTADGTVFQTGALATDPEACSAWRGQGPDLTGLFIGDCGALGVLSRAWIRLEPLPRERGFFACAVSGPADYLHILRRLSTLPGNYRAYCFDPGRSGNLQAQSVSDNLRTALKVLLSKSNPLQALNSAAQMLRTLRHWHSSTAPSPWAVHLVCEGSCRRQVAAMLDSANELAGQYGLQRLATGVAEALGERPYSVRGMLGKRYERWLPCHGIFPLHSPRPVAARILAALEGIRERIGAHRMKTHMLLINTGRHHVLIEPMFLWPGSLLPLHLQHCPDARQPALAGGNPVSDEEILAARKQLVILMDELGAQHVQLGRHYDYGTRLNPLVRRLLRQIKRGVDAEGMLAPGMLGLAAE